jgi:serine/threonine protein kinase
MTTFEAPETKPDFYKVGRMLGKGAFGKVSLALHKLANRLVAIKVLNKSLLDEASRKKVLNEVNILSQLRHSNVVK